MSLELGNGGERLPRRDAHGALELESLALPHPILASALIGIGYGFSRQLLTQHRNFLVRHSVARIPRRRLEVVLGQHEALQRAAAQRVVQVRQRDARPALRRLQVVQQARHAGEVAQLPLIVATGAREGAVELRERVVPAARAVVVQRLGGGEFRPAHAAAQLQVQEVLARLEAALENGRLVGGGAGEGRLVGRVLEDGGAVDAVRAEEVLAQAVGRHEVLVAGGAVAVVGRALVVHEARFADEDFVACDARVVDKELVVPHLVPAVEVASAVAA